jgi:hypothetical protein
VSARLFRPGALRCSLRTVIPRVFICTLLGREAVSNSAEIPLSDASGIHPSGGQRTLHFPFLTRCTLLPRGACHIDNSLRGVPSALGRVICLSSSVNFSVSPSTGRYSRSVTSSGCITSQSPAAFLSLFPGGAQSNAPSQVYTRRRTGR